MCLMPHNCRFDDWFVPHFNDEDSFLELADIAAKGSRVDLDRNFKLFHWRHGGYPFSSRTSSLWSLACHFKAAGNVFGHQALDYMHLKVALA